MVGNESRPLAVWTTAFINDLPDSAFLHVEAGGKKDVQGKTVPRNLRHFPYKDAQGNVDLPHLRNALARIPQSSLSAGVKGRATTTAERLLERAKNKAAGQRFVLAADAFPGQEITRTERNGQPIATFRKDIAKVGTWKHPREGWTLDVTPERMDRWVAAFKRMQGDGIAVEVTRGHSFDVDKLMGYVIDMERDGDSLYAVHEIIGEDNIELAEIARTVSPWIELDFVGGPKGQKYGEAIIHSSLCQQPVMSGQEDFVEIPAVAASGRAASRVGIYTFAAKNGSVSMDPKLLEVLRELIGADESLTEDNAAEKLTKAFGDLTADRDDLSKMLTEAKGQVETLTKAAEANGDDKPPELSPDAEDMLVEGAEARLDALVNSAKITPACHKRFHAVLVGAPGKRNAYALSRAVSGTAQSLVRMICDALAENDPVKLGEQTRAQAAVLSRVPPGGHAEPTDAEVAGRVAESRPKRSDK